MCLSGTHSGHECRKRFSYRRASVIASDALIRHAAEVEGISITEFTVAATMSRAIDVLADRRMFGIADTAWSEFVAVLDRPVTHKPRLAKLFSDPSLFTEE